MKLLLLIGSFVLLTTDKACKNKKTEAALDQCFKGRLEIKANCMNYTISLLEGNMDSTMYEASWTDENTGKEYRNAFALASKCSFPNTINEGDEFYFVIDSTGRQDCAVCMMYYPVPAKRLSIRVVQEPCAR